VRHGFLLWLAVATACLTWTAAGVAAEKPLAVLIDQLQPPHTPTERIQAAEALVAYRENATAAVLPLLQAGDEHTRYYACFALQRLGPDAAAALPALIEILARPEDLRVDAVWAIGRMGPAAAPAVPALKALLCTDPVHVGRPLVFAFKSIGPASVPALVECLRDANPEVVRTACTALQQLGPQAREAVPALADLASRSDESSRDAAFLALAGIGQDAVDALVRMLRDDDPAVRRWAAMSLSRIGSLTPAAETVLCELADDPHADVRFWVCRALSELDTPTPPAVDRLVLALQDQDANVRWQAVVSLGRIGTPAAKKAIAGLLNDFHPAVRTQAKTVLGHGAR
jgi:HEAT repeat protein